MDCFGFLVMNVRPPVRQNPEAVAGESTRSASTNCRRSRPENHGRVMRSVPELVAGLLISVAGLVPLLLWPGYEQASWTTPAAFPAGAIVVVGVILLVHAMIRVVRPIRSRAFPTNVRCGGRWRGLEGRSMLATGILILLVMTLLSIGVIPGWYYSTTGSYSVLILGCQWVGGSGVPSFPDGFPPAAHVSVSWETEDGTNISLTAYQMPPNSDNPNWHLTENGSLGRLSFSGSGSEMWVVAYAIAPCPSHEHVRISWSYTLSI